MPGECVSRMTAAAGWGLSGPLVVVPEGVALIAVSATPVASRRSSTDHTIDIRRDRGRKQSSDTAVTSIGHCDMPPGMAWLPW